MIGRNALVVFPELKVHRIQIEPKRVKATYTLIPTTGDSRSKELIYSYDTAYFDRQKGADVNLACMMLAQLALNYGLFFERITFDGLFDDTDRRFLRDMMENTSREILVLKFLRKNEFLIPPFDALKAEKAPRYTAARIEFENTSFGHLRLEREQEETDKNKFAILSSGGKDSLLSYGLIKELGDAHPVFINESGRHWFTAVNAYKEFKEREPNTAKPWCNSDRVFNWMARQFPFIKENFQNIRSDNYPIRLWTVAVFVFGVLPVVRRRRLGNILIGNEYDTTVKGTEQGISHYSGLYDQSKYFDNALTRYYHAKGWDIYQYSILRSLSELLILKILVKQYPELQKLQVSCHAAHQEQGRMLPCGKCEKCRRVVGMLKALGEDPGRCGYTEEQVRGCLEALASRSVKQLGSDAAHLYYLLLKKGLLPENEHTRKLGKPHPEILQLRFDLERSNFADLPVHIRKPLLKLLRSYSEGAVHLVHRKWHTFVPEEVYGKIPYFLKDETVE